MAEEKQPMGIVVGTYIGKEFKSKGKKQDGTEWKAYKVKVKVHETDNYPRTFDMFDGCKGQYTGEEGKDRKEAFSEGDTVKAGFVHGKPFQAHGRTITPNRICWIIKTDDAPTFQEPVGEPQSSSSSMSADATSSGGIVVSKTRRAQVKNDYLIACEKAGMQPSVNHYVGTVVRAAYADMGKKEVLQWILDDWEEIKPKPKEEALEME